MKGCSPGPAPAGEQRERTARSRSARPPTDPPDIRGHAVELVPS